MWNYNIALFLAALCTFIRQKRQWRERETKKRRNLAFMAWYKSCVDFLGASQHKTGVCLVKISFENICRNDITKLLLHAPSSLTHWRRFFLPKCSKIRQITTQINTRPSQNRNQVTRRRKNSNIVCDSFSLSLSLSPTRVLWWWQKTPQKFRQIFLSWVEAETQSQFVCFQHKISSRKI